MHKLVVTGILAVTSLLSFIIFDAVAADAPVNLGEQQDVIQMFIGDIKECWSVRASNNASENWTIMLKIKMDKDGRVLSVKQQNSPPYNGDPAYRKFVQSAVSAINKCSPYTNLPSDKYSVWQEMITVLSVPMVK